MKKIAAAIAGVLLVGCAKPMVWDKDGSSRQDFNVDNYECEKDVRQSGHFGTGFAGNKNMREFYKRCMVSKGWTLRED